MTDERYWVKKAQENYEAGKAEGRRLERRLGELLKGSFITTTHSRLDSYCTKIEFKTLKQAQALGEFLGTQWRKATKPAKRKEGGR